MKKYNFYFDGQVISRQVFEQAVPENWESKVVRGEYSYGYYRVIERD